MFRAVLGATIDCAAMRLHLLEYFLWCINPVLMGVIAVGMYRNRLYREFPYFFNYVVFQILSFAIEFPLRNWANYYYVYWTTSALSVVVAFAVLLEIFKDAFRPYEALRDLSVILFRWCALVVLLVAGMWAVSSWHGGQIDGITNVISLVDRSVRMMQCSLVLFLLLFNQYLGISRRNFVFGVALGFGFFAAVNMLVMTALAHDTVISHGNLRRINSFAYIVSAIVWLAYSILPSTVRSSASQTADSSHKWDQALDDARNAPPAVSVLDTMDQTVERLLYHKGSESGVTVVSRR